LKKYYPLIILFIFSCSEVPKEPDCAGIIGGNSICGCTDNSALNYLPDATFDDGSCEYLSDCANIVGGNSICGCMDSTATNYWVDATFDDGSCEFEIDTSNVDTTYGCTDSTAANYDSTAVLSDDSCAYSIQKLVWETYGSIETEFEIYRSGFHYVVSVTQFNGDSLNVVGYVNESDADIYSILFGIFTGYYNLGDYSSASSAPSGLWTTLTLIYETGWSQSYDSVLPDYPISEVYNFIELKVNEWCPEQYYSVDGECYHTGDISILQELMGNFAPGVIISMEEPEWEHGRLVNFICMGCTLEEMLPESMGNLNELRELIIIGTLLTGPLPDSLFDLNNLEVLILNNNQLTGVIPDTICTLPMNEMVIDLSQNQFCPPYPSCIESVVGEQDTSQCGVE
jgi:hypothetical protein